MSMKAAWLAIVNVFALAAFSVSAFAQAEAKASQAEAVKQFPDLAKVGSEFNKAFLAKLQAAKAAQDPLLSRMDWPMILATAAANELGVKPAAMSGEDPTAEPLSNQNPRAAIPGRAGELKFATGNVLQNAEIEVVDRDGLWVKHNGNVTKYRWNYFTADERARLERAQQAITANKRSDKLIESTGIGAIFEPFNFGEKRTTGWVHPYKKVPTGGFENRGLDRKPIYEWVKAGSNFIALLDEPMPKNVARGQKQVVVLYPIGHTDDSSRDLLFTSSLARAKEYYAQNPAALAEIATRENER